MWQTTQFYSESMVSAAMICIKVDWCWFDYCIKHVYLRNKMKIDLMMSTLSISSYEIKDNSAEMSICWLEILYNPIFGRCTYYNEVIRSATASQITDVSIVFSAVCSGADQIQYQSSVSLAFVRGIHPSPVNSPHKGPVTRKMFPFNDVLL